MEEKEKVDVEKLLAEGRSVQIKPRGYSMYPLFVPGRDEAVISPADINRLKRGDAVLYRRDGGILVLHRICRIRDGGIYTVGDNQKAVEGPLRPDQIRGILCGVIRNGRYFSVDHPAYIILSRIWLALRPVRPALSKTAAALKRTFGR